MWYQNIDKFLKSLGFTNSMANPNLYISQDIILILYVDDMLITAKDKIALAKFKKQMTQKYKMTDLGEAQQFLGLQIHRNQERKMLFIHQSQYIKNILTQLDMQDCNGISMPIEASSKLLAADPNESPKNQWHYQSIVGSLMYAMLGTWPDLAYAVSTLCRFLSNPINAYHRAMK